MTNDAWERFRHMTLDQLVTETKLGGSASVSYGRTTPEGWPFVVICAVGSPGNEVAMLAAGMFHGTLMRAGAPVDRTDNPAMPVCPGVEGRIPDGGTLYLHCPGCLETGFGK